MNATLSTVVTGGYQPAGDINLVTTRGYGLGAAPPPATAQVSGTITAAATEDDIRAGGKTIIIDLTNDTWVTAGAAFNAQRQAIINGLVSAQSEPAGWNAIVQAGEVVTAVVRTSNTRVTITLSAFPAYDITAPEVITDTVPAAALSTSLVAVVATPTFTITDVPPPPPPAPPSQGGGVIQYAYPRSEWADDDDEERKRRRKPYDQRAREREQAGRDEIGLTRRAKPAVARAVEDALPRPAPAAPRPVPAPPAAADPIDVGAVGKAAERAMREFTAMEAEARAVERARRDEEDEIVNLLLIELGDDDA